MTRLRVVLLCSSLVLALDAGRSYYARVGYAHPSETWEPNAAVYADLTWPPGNDVGPDRPLGERCILWGVAGPPMAPGSRKFQPTEVLKAGTWAAAVGGITIMRGDRATLRPVG